MKYYTDTYLISRKPDHRIYMRQQDPFKGTFAGNSRPAWVRTTENPFIGIHLLSRNIF